MKTILFTLTLAFIAFGAFGTTTSYANCSACESSEKAHKMKSCEKCMKAGKKCGCKGKKVHDHGDKPCKVCEQNDKRFELEKNMTKGSQYSTEKGTYHTLSRGMVDSGFND